MEQLDFYKSLLDEISDGVYFVNSDRVITYWNKVGGGIIRLHGARSYRAALRG